ncbi:MAG: DUF3419 family protein [Candidatus Diapherotrites archaeon]
MGKFSPMYVYATEMVGSYFAIMHLSGKKVLTISGSGDQVLNAIFLGAREVIGFDLNYYSENILRLKIAAIRTLSRESFLSFFGKSQKSIQLDYSIYRQIRPKLKRKCQSFFDRCYAENEYNGKALAESVYFRRRAVLGNSPIWRINLYLKNDTNYRIMRKKLLAAHFAFIQGDVHSIARNPFIKRKKWDLINLSNVPNYISPTLKKKDWYHSFSNKVLLSLIKCLSPFGKIIYYSYSMLAYPNKISNAIPLASTPPFFTLLKKDSRFHFSQLSIPGLNPGTRDTISVIEK